ncbi:isochorismate synthase [Frankia sp. EI5c]|uniref:isochorismate synthase n=1 Tax=Frankia sp. EI5c TaxID=683316 RepID=UPI001F5BE251|nr:isochorismate synthase [Frankia sp. EI5c]
MTEPADLLADYRSGGSFLFASRRGVLLAEGAAALVAAGPWGLAADSISGELAGYTGLDQFAGAGWTGTRRSPIAVGVVPFDLNRPGRLVVPAAVRESEPLDVPVARPRNPAAAPDDSLDPLAPHPHPEPEMAVRASGRLEALPTPADYAAGVARAVRMLRAGELDKVVLARTLRVPGPVDAAALLRRLARRDPQAFVFGAQAPLPAIGQPGVYGSVGGTLVGASPELLLSRRGPLVVSNPLAGSAARSADPQEDRRRAAALLASAKDAHEHAVVVGAVADALRPFCLGLDVPAAPSLIRTATMWHLSTRISGWLADPSVSSLRLAAALHPTPAVCGWPTSAARAALNELEPFDRGSYTGLVGWCDAEGDGEWALAIRCAEIASDGSLRLFAGAGIVAESRPADELAETSAKFRTLGRAMGLGDDL